MGTRISYHISILIMSNARVDAAKQSLTLIKAMISVKLRTVEQNCASCESICSRHVSQQRYEEARKAIPGFYSSYEQGSALKYVRECLNIVEGGIADILVSKACPDMLVTPVSVICYLRTIMRDAELDRFVTNFLQKNWGAAEIDGLARSNMIPDEVAFVNGRTRFTNEEVAGFVRTYSTHAKFDVSWFLDNTARPSATPSQSVRSFGQEVDRRSIPPRPADLPVHACHRACGDASRSELDAFDGATYGRMVEFMERGLVGWNAWRMDSSK